MDTEVGYIFFSQPMTEEEAIKFVILHLEVLAHEWWHHGIVTQGFGQVSTYVDLSHKLTKRFDRKDPEAYFHELTRLKQTSIMDDYVSEFQRLAVMVSDVSDERLMFFFIEGLSESFCGLVRTLELATLEEAIRRALSLEDSTQKGKTIGKSTPTGQPKKPFIKANPPPKGPPPRPHEMSRNELRKKGLCYYCKEKWNERHRCQVRGQVYYIEVVSDDEAETEGGGNEEVTNEGEQEVVIEGGPT